MTAAVIMAAIVTPVMPVMTAAVIMAAIVTPVMPVMTAAVMNCSRSDINNVCYKSSSTYRSRSNTRHDCSCNDCSGSDAINYCNDCSSSNGCFDPTVMTVNTIVIISTVVTLVMTVMTTAVITVVTAAVMNILTHK